MLNIRVTQIFFVSLVFLLGACTSAFAQENDYNPVYGPQQVVLGDGIATLSLPEGFLFFDKNDTRKFYEEAKEPFDDDILGCIVDEEGYLQIVLSYIETGYIRDDEANSLDPDDLFEVIKEGNDEQNEKRREMGGTPIEVIAWDKPPAYDFRTHTLTWSLVLREEGSDENFVNYKSVILGRYGILDRTIVCDYEDVDIIHQKEDVILSAVSFNQGRDYQSWESGDTISDITLTGLITGGAVATAYGAAKAGIITKIGKALLGFLFAAKKFIAVAIVVLGAVLKKVWNKVTGQE